MSVMQQMVFDGESGSLYSLSVDELSAIMRWKIRKISQSTERKGAVLKVEPARREDLLKQLPPEWHEDPIPEIRRQVKASGCKVVVLDDDPTGTQTVHDVPVLTGWSVEDLEGEFQNDLPAFYILTNSRSLSSAGAQALNSEIGHNMLEAARKTGRPFVVVSRSDSTLRGHFPAEVEALDAALGGDFHGWLIIPFFLEGGRFTIDDVHYVDENGLFVPAGKTEFARDKVFGYTSSDLRAWVEEKTVGRTPAGEVFSITLEDLRGGGPSRVSERLMTLQRRSMCVVNAASYRDLEVLVQGLLNAEARGRRFLYRTAASFVRVRAGLVPRPLLSRQDLNLPDSGGALIVVGSHVPRTTTQLQGLTRVNGVLPVEMDVESLLRPEGGPAEVGRVAQLADIGLTKGQDVVIYTSRKLRAVEDAEYNLSIGQQVSDALIASLRRISSCPGYIIAKGGITSSDVATKGLGVKRALVLGQIIPGVPVWQLGPESRYPLMPYVVFPGNVGGPEALAEVVRKLRSRPTR